MITCCFMLHDHKFTSGYGLLGVLWIFQTILLLPYFCAGAIREKKLTRTESLCNPKPFCFKNLLVKILFFCAAMNFGSYFERNM